MLSTSTKSHKTELVKILKDVISYLEKSEASDWTALTPNEVISKIKNGITQLDSNQKIYKKELIILFLPTSDIQEISMANSWTDEYLVLSESFDKLLKMV